MHVFGERNGVKFRVNCEGPPSIETMNAINKMVELVSKTQSNGKRKTIAQSKDRSGS